jgi:mannose-6-phosphate isomerase-like protein (cupin superfamily)
MRLLLLWFLIILPAPLDAQETRVFYYPKPRARSPYQPPMKPVTRLADLMSMHRGDASWHERVVDDGNSLAFMIQEPVGTRHERRLYPDSPAWWAVLEGRIRFEIERPDGTFDIFEATKGSYVWVPERFLHSFEVVGDEPAIRFEVTLALATPIFEKRPEVEVSGVDYIPVRLSTGPNPLDVPDPGGEPWLHHWNVYDLAARNEGRGNWSQEVIRKNRARGNLICGYPASGPATEPIGRGHFHSDFAETWVVMLGELRWVFEGDESSAIIARQGDIVYAPPQTFHSPQFWGESGLNCRLTSSTYPAANHIYDPD